MNKYREAKAWIDNINAHPYWAICDIEEPALSQLTKLVELATPESPYIWGDGYANGELVYDMWDCPNCGASYEIEYDTHDYCPCCGQSILWKDWSEEE